MPVLEKLWGNIPVGPETQGTRVFGAFGKRWLHVVARYMPLPPATRASLHRRRGVNVGRRVFIGTEVFIDDAVALVGDARGRRDGDRADDDPRAHVLPAPLPPAARRRGDAGDLRTTIRRGAYLGLRSTILAGVTVGEYAIVGAGSVVTADVPPYTMVAGVPARVVREFGPGEVDSRA